MSDKMNAEFTEWAAKQFDIPESLIVWTGEHPDDGYPVRVINEGEQSDEVNSLFGIAWLAFQASRSAMAVELPALGNKPNAWDYKGPYAVEDFSRHLAEHESAAITLIMCREALTKAGVTVK